MALPKVKQAPDANQQARQTAVDLIKQGKLAEAVSYLGSSLQTDPRYGSDALAVAVTQSLMVICFRFYSDQQLLTARTVATEALAQAAPLTRGSRSNPAMSDLYLTLGQMCEHVRFDYSSAQQFYQMALTARPGHPRAQAHLLQVQEKLRNQAPGRP
jgi:hypothetical protein